MLLQLKHCDGLRGAELGKMFGCDESVISRRLDKAQERIAAMTLWKIRQTDPWLELKWTDFLELCRSATPSCFGLDLTAGSAGARSAASSTCADSNRSLSDAATNLTTGRWLRAKRKTNFGFFSKL